MGAIKAQRVCASRTCTRSLLLSNGCHKEFGNRIRSGGGGGGCMGFAVSALASLTLSLVTCFESSAILTSSLSENH